MIVSLVLASAVPDGKLPAHVMAYLTLALCLFADDDYEEVATKVTGSLDRWGCCEASWSVPSARAITRPGNGWGARCFRRSSSGPAGPSRVRRSRRLGCPRWALPAGRSRQGGGYWRSRVRGRRA
ncbi:MAG: transposase domain-containing protein [Pseudonocardiaceae bacterium]